MKTQISMRIRLSRTSAARVKKAWMFGQPKSVKQCLIGGHAQYEILFPGSNDTAQAARWTLDNYTRFTSLTDMLRRRGWRSLE